MTQRLCDHDRRRAVSQQCCCVGMPELVKRYHLHLSLHERSFERSLIGTWFPRRAVFLPEQWLSAVSIGRHSFEQLNTRFAQPDVPRFFRFSLPDEKRAIRQVEVIYTEP